MITTISYNLNLIKINLLFTCKSSLLHVVLILPYLLVTVNPLESIYGGVHSSNAVESSESWILMYIRIEILIKFFRLIKSCGC